MKWISGLMVLMLLGCSVNKKPIHAEVTFECLVDTVNVYVPVKFVPPDLTQKVQNLKKENHLLRVEIDKLKAEAINIQKMFEIKRATKKVSVSINKLKKELCKE